MKKVIPIFFATDENYAPFLTVVLESMTDRASKEYQYNIHVLSIGLSDTVKDALSKYDKDNFKLIYNDISEKIEKFGDKLFTRDYFSKTTYYRMFIPDMFPEYEKALYLDCDIVLNGDISELYNIDIGNNYVGAITCEAMEKHPEFAEYADKFLDVQVPEYFNAGILIMNLSVLRKENLEGNFIDLLHKIRFIVAQDQDYLNVLCKGKVFHVSKLWNKIPMLETGIELKDIKLVHYNLAFKPWHYDNVLYEELFWKYAKKSKCYDAILEHKRNFTGEKVRLDKEAGENLKILAKRLANEHDTYAYLSKSGKL